MVIVGAGDCGARAALALREQGYSGPVTLISEEAHAPYERPSLSKQVLLTDAQPTPIVDDDRLKVLGITFLHPVRILEVITATREIRCENGQAIPYSKLLLATGAMPRHLPGAEGVFYLRNRTDAEGLRTRLVRGTRLIVLGAGFLGLEIAAAARSRGAEVIVLEVQHRVLQRGVPPEIAAALAERHARAGVAIRTAVSIERAEGAPACVWLAGGEIVRGDTLVAALGATPNTDLALSAGLAVDNGILVDENLRTSDPHVFAAGDCCAFPLPLTDHRIVRIEAWRNALEHASLAAHNMVGGRRTLTGLPWFWSDQYDTTLQVVGLYSQSLVTVRRDIDSESFVLFHFGPHDKIVAASGYGPTGRVARDMKLAELLIVNSARVDPAQLSRRETKLKSLLPVS